MIKINPEDIIIQIYNNNPQGGMHVAQAETGVRVYHKPSGEDISVDRYKSQHKNRVCCMEILKGLLTELEVGDIVYSKGKVAIIVEKGFNVCTVEYEDGSGKQTEYLDHTALTKECYIYITTKRKLEMIADYQKDIDNLNESIKLLQKV